MPDDEVSTCSGCGASVYPEHVESGIAGYQGGKLLCPHCFTEATEKADAEDTAQLRSIALDDEPSPAQRAVNQRTAIHGFSGDTLAAVGEMSHDESKFKRKADPNSPMAMRCRTFHSKLNAGAVSYMNDQINTWVDSDPHIKLKFATSTIGVFEGKQKDPHLIVTVFY